jgi:hypothetical protein
MTLERDAPDACNNYKAMCRCCEIVCSRREAIPQRLFTGISKYRDAGGSLAG